MAASPDLTEPLLMILTAWPGLAGFILPFGLLGLA